MAEVYKMAEQGFLQVLPSPSFVVRRHLSLYLPSHPPNISVILKLRYT